VSDRAKIKGEYPYYGASGIIDYVNDYIFDEEIILLGEDGENIVSRNLPLAFRVSGKCWVNNHAHVIKPNAEYNIDFITQCLENINYLEYNTGTAQPKLNQEVCKLLPLRLPSLGEQTKIANFLRAVDEKITQLTQKHELLNQYKKGVMQKIFSQELRFKDVDGSEFPNWDTSTLEDILDYEQPTKYLVSSVEYDDNYATPVLTAGKTFILGYTDEKSGIFQNNLPVIIFDDFTTAFKFVSFPFKAKSSAMKILKIKTPTDSIKYVYEAMQQIEFPSGGEHKRYWISEYSKISIPLPGKKEQTKIANFLTAIDEKIISAQSQLEFVKRYKQGLLQQMFV